MSDIQSIKIISTEVVDVPKSHVVYVIQVSTPIRTWTVKRRYSDFISLHSELKSSVGKEPPGSLPAKHWSLIKGVGDDKLIRERRILLEQYLILILTNKDPSFRQSYGFKDFLSVASNTNPSHPSSVNFTSQSWLLEHTSLQNLLRSARSALLKRDALASMGDSVASRSSSIEAKKILKEASQRIHTLEDALGLDSMASMGEGEKKRRYEMVEQLKIERETLNRMAEVGIRTSTSAFSRNSEPSGSRSNGSSSFEPTGTTRSNGGSLNSLPGGFPQGQQISIGRTFGVKSPPQETSETRPLDDRGLLQLQVQKMDNQDDQLKELSKLLQRQKQMGEEIHQEIGEQNDLLDEIESGVDKTGRKLGKTKRELNRLG
ncbi:hypothetical protein L486_02382 [Kwoniella mangroviensis CBS 10435]|uniref:Syntaxin n=1 Tax=Kwoniella mangroviensis CBS 10435 TaxID=1331196 RepID=A0A1B9IVZ3_9TREE|nr:uncharacterized protein I203_04455 [Kwoniella mangroviensis CBS 8507]OCF59710.1 hypothetical protein L486_02382 [Kwoniella mangroviensis CBS 10435]OCF66129.1 hypothetical protein I203_04455 [Kwoniella mangroviensis CBS 8507]OCF71231.1 hypothetical protein I204_08184 [Kwoniella mangroviensis CBS 8886]